MARRKSSTRTKVDWRQTVFLIFSLLIILSMVLGLVAVAFS